MIHLTEMQAWIECALLASANVLIAASAWLGALGYKPRPKGA